MRRLGPWATRLVGVFLTMPAWAQDQLRTPTMLADRAAAQVMSDATLLLSIPRVERALRAVTREEIQNRARALKTEAELQDVERIKAKREKTAEQARDKQIRYQLTQSIKWNQLSNNPELARDQIPSGRALNFLLERFDAEVLSNANDLNDDPRLGPRLSQMKLRPELLAKLTLQQRNSNGQYVSFQANGAPSLGSDTVPYVMRVMARNNPDFKVALESYQSAMRALVEGKGDFVDLVENAKERLKDLAGRHGDCQPGGTGIGPEYLDFLKSKVYLDAQRAFLRRIQETQQLPDDSLQYVPKRDGESVDGLLSHMLRNGLTFGPAKPGNEEGNQVLFRWLRELYKVSDPDVDLNQF